MQAEPVKTVTVGDVYKVVASSALVRSVASSLELFKSSLAKPIYTIAHVDTIKQLRLPI